MRTTPGSPAGAPAGISTLTVGTILDHAMATRPDAEALATRSGRLTYADLDAAANRAANALLALGVGPGERVAVSLPNDAPVAVTLLATARIGAVWVGINSHLAGPEKAFIVADSGAVLLVADEASVAALAGHSVAVDMPALRRTVTSSPDPARDEWGKLTMVASTVRPELVVAPLDVAAIGYTSGTTGFPKGVVHCHRALVMQGAVFTSTRAMNKDSRYGIWMPLCNIQSLMMSVITMAQVAGATVVIDHSDAATIATWVEREHVTHLPSVAATLNDLTSNPAVTASMLQSLEEITAGGGEVPQSVVERFHDLSGVYPSVGYGQTEASGAISMTPAGEPPVPGAVGKPLPHLDIMILGDDGPVATGEIGELCVRATQDGPWAGLFTPMVEYWRHPAETAGVIRDGWLHTGDLCSLGDEGDLYVRGRKTAMILRGGANVYPAEVERVLLDEPGVDAAAVLGVADERLGERVVAIVAPLPGRTVTSERCMERCRTHLARFKCPDKVVVVDELPRNATGKVIRPEALRLFLEHADPLPS